MALNQLPATFYYTPNGIEPNTSTPLEHLALGQALNVVANNRKQLEVERTILNYGKANGKFYAQVGLSTGEIVDQPASDFWPNWVSETSTVFEVVWVTKLVEVPNEYFINQRQGLPGVDAQKVVNYVLKNK